MHIKISLTRFNLSGLETKIHLKNFARPVEEANALLKMVNGNDNEKRWRFKGDLISLFNNSIV